MRILFALFVVQTIEQFREAVWYTLAHNFVVHRSKLLAELCSRSTIKPAGLCGLFVVFGV